MPTLHRQLSGLGESGIAGDVESARESLIAFTQRLFPRYRASRHHYLIAAKLEAVERGEIDRLIITMPPRHGKSELASVNFPPWYLGRNPHKRIIACSYSQDLANRMSRRARNKMREPNYPFAAALAADLAMIRQWDTTEGGGYIAAGVRGPIMGSGADLLLIDDPIKNAEDADSQLQRDAVWDWYTETAYNRLEAGASVVVITTRWNEDDLVGRLLAAQGTGGDQWEVLHLPAIADEANDALDRAIGEPLWPERYTIAELDRRRANSSSRMWLALYQGRPVAMEGDTFKRHWWRFWHYADRPLPPWRFTLADGREFSCPVAPLPPTFDEQIQSWDMAFKKTADGSFVVGQIQARVRAEVYLLEQFRSRMNFVDTLIAVRAISSMWPNTTRKLVENKANGPAVVNALHAEVAGLIEVEPEGGKEARANAVSGFVESGNVYLPHPMIAPWVEQFIDELAAFPNAPNDDQVDAFSQGVIHLLLGGKAGGGAVSTEQYASWQNTTDPEDPWGDENG